MPGYGGRMFQRVGSPMLKAIRGAPSFELELFRTYEAYHASMDRARARRGARESLVQRLIPAEPATTQFRVLGYCSACDRWVGFLANREGGGQEPNWRETLLCPHCFLNNRMRAGYAMFRKVVRPTPATSVYMTEEITNLFDRVKAICPNTSGSEFLVDGTPPGGRNAGGVRFEDLTRLTFADGQFDAILSFEVLEHVPDYPAALRECARVLRPGGTLILTTPFHGGPETTTRARIGPGGVEHLLPPEYHGDPLSDDGCLCFYHFGGDLLDSIRSAGFREAKIANVYSRPLGHFPEQPTFLATK